MPPSKIPLDQQDAMVQAYLAGSSLVEAAKPFGYGWKACWNALKRRGIAPRSQPEASHIDPQQEEIMVQAYLAGASTGQAARLIGCSPQTCTNVLIRRGLPVRSREEVSRRYQVDQTFFDTIDSEAKAYWLGFLTADAGIAGHHIRSL